MKIKLSQNEFANLDIEAGSDLLSTAKILAEIFGGLKFERDTGHYEEYPAYVAHDKESGFKFALLGIPDPGYEIRENPSPHYNLLVEPIDWRGEHTFTVNVSRHVAAFINADGCLKAMADEQ
jgi:hypothetical protein